MTTESNLSKPDLPTSSTTNDTTLPQHNIFADPQTFLKILQKDYNQIAKSHDGCITQNDLAAYAKSGEDPEGREAAKIALKHFDELTKLPDLNLSELDGNHNGFSYEINGQTLRGISKYDLQKDLDMFSGKTESYIRHDRIYGSLQCAAEGLVGLASAALTAVTAMELPWLAAAAGVGAVYGGFDAYLTGKNVYNSSRNYHDLSKRDRQILKSWTEINAA